MSCAVLSVRGVAYNKGALGATGAGLGVIGLPCLWVVVGGAIGGVPWVELEVDATVKTLLAVVAMALAAVELAMGVLAFFADVLGFYAKAENEVFLVDLFIGVTVKMQGVSNRDASEVARGLYLNAGGVKGV